MLESGGTTTNMNEDSIQLKVTSESDASIGSCTSDMFSQYFSLQYHRLKFTCVC